MMMTTYIIFNLSILYGRNVQVRVIIHAKVLKKYKDFWWFILGYPWYPALIFDADLSQDEPILHGDEELPQPSFDIIEIGNKLNRNQDDTERYNLVLFFDARRTW